jgi:hypothetical protein
MRVYYPSLVIVTWGPVIFRAFHKGTMVKVSHDEDATKAESGAQGDIAVTVSASRLATATITLQQLSISNDQLAPLAASNRPRGSPLQVFPFTIKDQSNPTAGVFVFGEEAWIKKAADLERGDDHSPAEWQLQIADCTILTGGFVQ